jgi:hypothetical protein
LSLAWLIGRQSNSTSVTNEINARITNEFTARITSDATLASTDVDKTANTPSIKAYIDNSSEFTGYTGTVLFERTLSTALQSSYELTALTVELKTREYIILCLYNLCSVCADNS